MEKVLGYGRKRHLRHSPVAKSWRLPGFLDAARSRLEFSAAIGAAAMHRV
jgi:hypothetical protein